MFCVCGALGLLEDPWVDVALPGGEAFAGEEDGDLAPSAGRAVRAVDEIAANLEAEVGADGAGGGFGGAGGAHDLAGGGDGVGAFEHAGDDGAGGDVFHEAVEEGLAFVLAVVLAGHVAIHFEEAEADHAEAAALEAGEDFAGEAPLHGVWLDEDESAFECHGVPFVT